MNSNIVNISSDFKIFYTNLNGLRNKVNELQVCAETYKPMVICVTETHLKDELDAEVQLVNYRIFRKDWEGTTQCGGSAVYVHSSLSAYIHPDFNSNDSIALVIELPTFPVIVACVYRSQALTEPQNLNMLKQLLKLQFPSTMRFF